MAIKLHTRKTEPGLREVGVRVLIVVGVILGVTLVFYVEGGLKDSHTGLHPGFWDCFYFAMVTITTVGYGDIVPVDTQSRLFDAVVMTPARFIVILTVFGTAYQIALRRFQEGYRMKRAIGKLNSHIIVCGYGATGRAVLRELLLQGTAPEQVVVLDLDPERLDEASESGVVCVAGDATREHTLQSVAIDRAADVLVCPGRDDTAALITMTVRALNPGARVVVLCQESENAKLLERGGANHIVNPAYAGGTLMAAATRREHLADTMEDILSVGGSLKMDERPVRPEEVGAAPAALPGVVVVRVYRGGRHFDVADLPTLTQDDVLVFLASTESRATTGDA